MKPETRTAKAIARETSVNAMLHIMPLMPTDMEQEHWLACVLVACGVPHREAASRLGCDPRSIFNWAHKYADLVEDIRVSRKAFCEAMLDSTVAMGSAIGFNRASKLLAQDGTVSDELQHAKYVETMSRLVRPETTAADPGDRDRPRPKDRRSAARALRALECTTTPGKLDNPCDNEGNCTNNGTQ